MSWGRSNRLSRIFDPALPRSVVLRVSGGTSVVGPSLSDETIVTGVEDALRLNAAAVAHGQGVQDALDLYQRLAGAPVPASR
jgi:DhnA family fructose-bisphosphate aldolase class Ia